MCIFGICILTSNDNDGGIDMPKINIASTGHGGKVEHYAGGLTIQYNVYPQTTTKEKSRIDKVKKAVHIIDGLDRKIHLNGPCNKYFKKLPKNRSFNSVWRDPSIFIDFSPSTTSGFFGATHSSLKDVTLTAWCIDANNIWMIAATIVHEFAHVDGAPGGTSHAAEKANDMCGFKPQYDPTIVGSIRDLSKYLEKIAA